MNVGETGKKLGKKTKELGKAGFTELTKISGLVKELEEEVNKLKTKEVVIPSGFMKRITSLETKCKTIEKTLKPARRIPAQFRTAKNIFADKSSAHTSP